MSVFFISDPHFGHKLAAEERGFASVEEHDQLIVDMILSRVTKRCKTFFLGDVAFGPRALERIRQIPGIKALVLGNHDRLNAKRYLGDGLFNDLHGAVRYNEFLLTHVPSQIVSGERWRGNLHGHIHSRIGSGEVSRTEVSQKHLNLACERWQFTPLAFDEIEEIFAQRKAYKEACNGA